MTEINIAEGIGKEIIKHLHDYYEEIKMDDAEYIPLIKRVIKAINNHIGLYDISKSENETLKETLLTYAKDLYVEICQIHAKENNEDISSEQVKEESEEFFDYIYKHEEYPD
jgi:hypothetical protein